MSCHDTSQKKIKYTKKTKGNVVVKDKPKMYNTTVEQLHKVLAYPAPVMISRGPETPITRVKPLIKLN